MKSKKPKRKGSEVEAFIALPDDEKERIFQELERQTPEERDAESRPLTSSERGQLARFRRGLSRPKIAGGAKSVNVTVEQGLLRRADSWAKDHGLTRAELFARGLELVMGGNGVRRKKRQSVAQKVAAASSR
jgi:hypothetical protein